jgi:hypothetical protein
MHLFCYIFALLLNLTLIYASQISNLPRLIHKLGTILDTKGSSSNTLQIISKFKQQARIVIEENGRKLQDKNPFSVFDMSQKTVTKLQAIWKSLFHSKNTLAKRYTLLFSY